MEIGPHDPIILRHLKRDSDLPNLGGYHYSILARILLRFHARQNQK
jgi:hypothetical protein